MPHKNPRTAASTACTGNDGHGARCTSSRGGRGRYANQRIGPPGGRKDAGGATCSSSSTTAGDDSSARGGTQPASPLGDNMRRDAAHGSAHVNGTDTAAPTTALPALPALPPPQLSTGTHGVGGVGGSGGGKPWPQLHTGEGSAHPTTQPLARKGHHPSHFGASARDLGAKNAQQQQQFLQCAADTAQPVLRVQDGTCTRLDPTMPRPVPGTVPGGCRLSAPTRPARNTSPTQAFTASACAAGGSSAETGHPITTTAGASGAARTTSKIRSTSANTTTNTSTGTNTAASRFFTAGRSSSNGRGRNHALACMNAGGPKPPGQAPLLSAFREKKVYKCPICLLKPGGASVVGRLKCTHAFCFGCIKEWSSVSTNCPLCKTPFQGIDVFRDLESKVMLNTVPVAAASLVHDAEDDEHDGTPPSLPTS